ncbi:MAG: dienelactone hydrolase family protein [Saprospiraceae bacterium]
MVNLQFEDEVDIAIDGLYVSGDLKVPLNAKGIILFSHGSGSSRHSPRNKYVAGYFNKRQIGTLLFDLLTEEEDKISENRFNLPLLSSRLIEATKWILDTPVTFDCNIGYFGASTGAASALIAASELKFVKAVVSRGGRPDLAFNVLPTLKTPTLLIVGSEDHEVIKLNESALAMLPGKKKMDIIPGATHLFEEPGTLDLVCESAYEWFDMYL